MSDKGIYRIVKKYSDGKLRPHKIRHSVITALLESSNGNLKQVQDFSRHKNPAILMIYDDNRQQNQRNMVNLASNLL